MSPDENEMQRRSFDSGDAHLSSSYVTREMIDLASTEIHPSLMPLNPQPFGFLPTRRFWRDVVGERRWSAVHQVIGMKMMYALGTPFFVYMAASVPLALGLWYPGDWFISALYWIVGIQFAVHYGILGVAEQRIRRELNNSWAARLQIQSSDEKEGASKVDSG